jgi:membrane-associated phospholipid phosphatase
VRAALVAIGLVTVLETEARAENREPHALAWDPDIDIPLTVVAGLGWIGTESVKGTFGPNPCHWCSTNGFDEAARDLRWGDTLAAHALSNVLGFAVGPALILGADFLAAFHDKTWKQFFVDALLVTEAAMAASVVNQFVKFSVARERPFATHLSAAEKLAPNRSTDEHLSFYSGHTTLMFSLATSAGTIASMRGYRWAPLVWAIGLPCAFATGYLRVAADDHWMTDVIVGAVAGAAIGFTIPFFAHRRVKVIPNGAGAALAGSF